MPSNEATVTSHDGAHIGFMTSVQDGGLRLLDVLRNRLRIADEVDIAVAFVRSSGLGLLRDALQDAIHRGAKVRILTSTYMDATQPAALESLRHLEGIQSKVFDSTTRGFHVKLYLFFGDSAECWIGSSNLTKGGLATNLELNLCLRDRITVGAARTEFLTLWDAPASIPIGAFDLERYTLRARRAFEGQLHAPQLQVERLSPVSDADDVPDQSWQTADDTLAPTPPEPDAPIPSPLRQRVGPTPNEFQREAMQRLSALREQGERKATVIAAPGVGKTYLAAFDAQFAGAESVLFVSHRREHLLQAQRTFASVFPGVSSGLVDADNRSTQSAHVFSTVQSAHQLLRSGRRHFDYVVVDEFHHAVASTYKALLDAVSPGFLLGLTATPERQDGQDVLALCDHVVAYEIRLIEAINRGRLIPFHYFGVNDETVDYAQIPWRSGRFDPEALENALAVEARNDHILRHAIELGYDGPSRATVGFCAGVRHARFMAESWNRRGLVAAYVTGSDHVSEREKIYARFSDPEDPLEWLFVSDVMNEGVDIPAINSVLFLRPTQSSTIFIQQLGRGMRLSPRCKLLTVIDFVGNQRRAWDALLALHDERAPAGPSSVQIGRRTITPPRDCEVVLSDETRLVLEKVHAQGRNRRERLSDFYHQMREELDAPVWPYHLSDWQGAPSLSEFRSVFGSWSRLRSAMDDADEWETDSSNLSHPLIELLDRVERNWQQSRVYAYAAAWALAGRPRDLAQEYDRFFERFPRWRTEYAPLSELNVLEGLRKEKMLGEGLLPEPIAGTEWQLHPDVFSILSPAEVQQQVEFRLRAHLDHDYNLRHGGILRSPDDLVVHARYLRNEVVNHFGTQYDPAKHNMGILRFRSSTRDDIVIITKIDTSTAKKDFHYVNQLLDPTTFAWQSQNRNTQETEPIVSMIEPSPRTRVHLFVQPRSHSPAFYLGQVSTLDAEGEQPVNIRFLLSKPTTAHVAEELGLSQ